jgi:allophanate hydrolase
MTPTPITLDDYRQAYRNGTLTPRSAMAQLLSRIDASCPPEVFICRVPADRLAERAAALTALMRDEPDPFARMPLFGIPFVVKDNIDVAGLPTTCACPDFSFQPAATAAVVERLEAAGALLIGKTNLDQFATGLVGTRSPYGEVKNPFDPAYVSGGSSSGSAVAVSLGLAAFSLGTDTAGSGRVPAGFCNLVGVKPTPGLVSTRGVFPACRSLDCVSVFSHTVAEGWAVLSVLAGPDAGDCYSHAIPALPPLAREVRIGIPAPLSFLGDTQAEQAFRAAREALRTLPSIRWSEVPFAPLNEVAQLLYGGPWVAERRLAIADFFDYHGKSMDPTVRAVIAKAEGKTAVDAFAALYRLEAGKRLCEQLFADVDLLLVPTTPTIHTRATVAGDPVARNSDFGLYTNFVNLLGMSALALPGPFRADGLPAGITLLAPAGGDHRLAEFARQVEPLLHRRLGTTALPPAATKTALTPLPTSEPQVRVAVVGAHLSGMPLNWQLAERSARLLSTTRTAAQYQLFALPGTVPPKPGLIRVEENGAAIELEVWEMPARHYGSFVAGIPAPLGIGMLRLEDGSEVQGFLCDPLATRDADDISRFGGWRAYMRQRATP